MVNSSQEDPHSPLWLAIRMVFYAVAFLGFILLAVPYGFYRLGEIVFPLSNQTWLAPEQAQRTIGVVIFVAGLVGYLICSNWLVIVGKGPFVEFDPPKKFVASGPYRWMRNPIAAFLLVTVLGEAIYFNSVGILALFVIGIPIAQYQVRKIEEPRLRERFGQSYIDYCQRVPRWLPRPPRDDSPLST